MFDKIKDYCTKKRTELKAEAEETLTWGGEFRKDEGELWESYHIDDDYFNYLASLKLLGAAAVFVWGMVAGEYVYKHFGK